MTKALELKTATAALHYRVEQTPISRLLMSDDIHIGDYEEVLARTFGVIDPIETALQAFPECDAMGRRPRAPDLLDDLIVLGWSENRVRSLPKTPAPVIKTLPQALGAAYVIEGARSGAKIIGERLKSQFGGRISPSNGMRFFSPSQTFGKPTFLIALGAWLETSSEADFYAVTHSAKSVFSAFIAGYGEELAA